MKIPLEITFRGMEKMEEIENHIRRSANKLSKFHSGIVSCRVVVRKDQEDQRSGNPYRVRVVVRIPPGKELIGKVEAGKGESQANLQTDITEAFEAIRRQIIKTKDKRHRGAKLHHVPEIIGQVVKIFPERGYGFIQTTEGSELFFHENAVSSGHFDQLKIGTNVKYFTSDGDQGPHASSVQVIGT